VSAYAALDSLRTAEGWLTASSGTGRFASLFGRDSLIAALQLLRHDPTIAHATIDRLGRELGRERNPLTEEEPGKVLHEARDGDLEVYERYGWPVREGKLRYYGSADASAWFLIVFGALRRAGEDVAAHHGAADAVATYLANLPMPVSYQRRNPHAGLQHHGWRDVAWDLEGNGHGVVGEDGQPLRPPVALAAIQALTWRALVEAGPRWADAAGRARAAFEATFLLGHEVAFARTPAGLDRSATSDLGHIAWTGILDGATERAVRDPLERARRLPRRRLPHGNGVALRLLARRRDPRRARRCGRRRRLPRAVRGGPRRIGGTAPRIDHRAGVDGRRRHRHRAGLGRKGVAHQ
jgi:glycogen debranching enzyme